ncbi:MAG: UrcA family protein [Sphingomonas sp.]|uniref:UrcA family protein n=1 Tax=Sphingomonas sp. TaxID=28214 RepID=UPI00184F8622|nr:UrcA family protein [Sphingomonas sp.]MBA3666432.1 UrcA family protein [Sphingomonas sp.]
MTRLLPFLMLSVISVPLSAQPIGPTTRVVVAGDLDLSTATGLRILDQRLTIAIVDACGEASPSDLVGQNQVSACKVNARTQVRTERDRIVAQRTQPAQSQIAAR